MKTYRQENPWKDVCYPFLCGNMYVLYSDVKS